MEKVNINSPEDIERVENVIIETRGVLQSMGNNSNEEDQIKEVKRLFDCGDLTADQAILKLRYMPELKQQGSM